MRWRCAAPALGLALAALPAAVEAHPLGAEGRAALPLSATLEGAATILVVGGVATLYLAGVGRLWARAGTGRGLGRIETAAFVGGCFVLALALVAPLSAPLTAGFAGHMAQHLLLTAVAAPLLAAGRPGFAFAWGLRGTPSAPVLRAVHRAAGSRLGRAVLTAPAVVVVYAVVLWAWHLPALYDAAERVEAVHALEHGTMLAAAFLFWSRIRSLAAGSPGRQLLAVAMLFAVMFPGLVLGAFLTFARTPLYASHLDAGTVSVDSALDQQQLGGLLMLMLGGLVYVGTVLALLLRLIGNDAPTRTTGEGRRVVP